MPDIEQIKRALQQHGGNKSAAATELGISRHAILRRLGGDGKEAQSKARRHLVIPDCQVKSGVPLAHLSWIGRYIAEKRPDVVVCIGDFADLPSLSSYDVGKKSFEGRRYKKDLEACHQGMELLCQEFVNIPDYKPRMVLTLGNHEARINRVVETDAKLEGIISIDDLGYEAWGWEVFPFLKVVEIDSVQYSHYFTSGVMGRPASSAAVALRERQKSCVQGHVQHIDISIHKKTQAFSLFSGICYRHEEDYLGEQGNTQKPGIWMLNEVQNGTADLLQISLGYLERRYGS